MRLCCVLLVISITTLCGQGTGYYYYSSDDIQHADVYDDFISTCTQCNISTFTRSQPGQTSLDSQRQNNIDVTGSGRTTRSPTIPTSGIGLPTRLPTSECLAPPDPLGSRISLAGQSFYAPIAMLRRVSLRPIVARVATCCRFPRSLIASIQPPHAPFLEDLGIYILLSK